MARFSSVLILYILGLSSLYAIDFVPVGDPDNIAASNGEGAVEYPFEIGRYEITNSEYCRFLNNVAREQDPYELFSPLMEEHFFGGIERSWQEDSIAEYKVKPGYESLPVGGVTFMSAIRFINWLHYNSDNIEKGVASTDFLPLTEGTETIGAYSTSNVPVKRNKGAKYWLPSKDEWLKANYFDGKNWDESIFNEGSNVYDNMRGWSNAYPHLKPVGKNVDSSHYGTFDQQGNVAEWVENSNGDFKLALGGSLIRPRSFAVFSEYEGDFPDKSIITFGFRVARSSDGVLRRTESSCPDPDDVCRNLNNYVSEEPECDGIFVKIGYPGNIGDVVNQYRGRVNYEFYMSRDELSNERYCEFLNSVAKDSDDFGLYDVNMGIGVLGGIDRTMDNGQWTYTCKPGFGKLPVVYVSYYDIARYCNWLHFGRPHGRQVVGVTEGTDKAGAYDTRDFLPVLNGEKKPYADFGKRNRGALYWIPNGDEWYKAAYFDPQKLGNRPYHDYPTRSSDKPSQWMANYMAGNHLAIPGRYIAPVDSFANAESFFGTRQQGGNVWEWIEDWQYGVVGNRALRGGSWSYTEFGLNALNEDPGGNGGPTYLFGARIAKAANQDGYVPVSTPITDRAVIGIKMLSSKKLIAVTVVLSILSLIGIVCVLKVIYRICANILRKSGIK